MFKGEKQKCLILFFLRNLAVILMGKLLYMNKLDELKDNLK